MEEKNISGVLETLYIPLAGRIYISKNFPTFFYDEKALSLEKITADKKLKINNEYFHFASVSRQLEIDKKIKDFIDKYNSFCNIVFLGAGLETAYYRINNQKALFYQIDFEEVIKLRLEILGKAKNESLISTDILSYTWISSIDTKKPTLFVGSGVFQYFKEEEVKGFIKKIKDNFENANLIFDATNKKGLKLANKFVKKSGNKNAEMFFYIDDIELFAKQTNTELISFSGFYKDALRLCKKTKFKTKLFMYFSDKLKRTNIIYLKLV